MSTLFPGFIDQYTTKLNKTAVQEGDIVYAEHVNDLQSAVVAIETEFGIGTSNLRRRMETLEASVQSDLVSTLIYAGNPLAVNGTTGAYLASDVFSSYDNVIINESYNADDSSQRDAFLVLCSKTNIYGKVSISQDTDGGILPECLASINRWKTLGAKGICLYNFGYGYSFNRTFQNLVVDTIHNLGLQVIVTEDISQIITVTPHATYNPSGAALNLAADDILLLTSLNDDATYLTNNFGTTEDTNQIYGTVKVFDWFASTEYDFRIHLSVYASEKRTYYSAIALALGADGLCIQTDDGSSGTISVNVQNSFPWPSTRSSVAANYNGTLLIRYSEYGKIEVNTSTQDYSISGLKIPGKFIEFGDDDGFSVSESSIRDIVIPAINNYSGSEKIAVNKLANFAQTDYAILKNGVVGSLLNIGANEPLTLKVPAVQILEAAVEDGYDIIALINRIEEIHLTHAYINSAFIDTLSASTIRSIYAAIDRLDVGTIKATQLEVGTVPRLDMWTITAMDGYLYTNGTVPDIAETTQYLPFGAGETGLSYTTVTQTARDYPYTHPTNGTVFKRYEYKEPSVSHYNYTYTDSSSISHDIDWGGVVFNFSTLLGLPSSGVQPHTVVVETCLVLNQEMNDIILNMYAMGVVGVYVDGVCVGGNFDFDPANPTTDYYNSFEVHLAAYTGGEYVPLSAGTHRIAFIYQYVSYNNSPSVVCLSNRFARDTKGNYPYPQFNRIDCYAAEVTYIEGAKIVTSDIIADRITSGTLNANEVLISAMNNGGVGLKLGKLDTGVGLEIYDSDGNATFKTDDKGGLRLLKYIQVGSLDQLEDPEQEHDIAGISAEGDSGYAVRFWAGTAYSNREDAPFKVTQNGNLYAANAEIAGVLKTVTFKYDSLTTSGGSMIIIESDYLTESLTFIASQIGTDEDGYLTMNSERVQIKCSDASLFEENDIIRLRMALEADLYFKVKATNTDNNYLLVQLVFNKQTTGATIASNTVFPEKTAILNYGQATSGHIILHTADNADGSTYIELLENQNNTPWGVIDDTGLKRRVRIGHLDEVTGADNDYGIYTERIYITGPAITIDSRTSSMVLGGHVKLIGTDIEKINDDPIRIAAGVADTNGNYPFMVTDSGYLYASNARIEGSTYTGIFDAGNVYIDDRRVSNDNAVGGWDFFVHPDDNSFQRDATKYLFRMSKSGIFVNNYTMSFYQEIGNPEDDAPDVDQAFLKISDGTIVADDYENRFIAKYSYTISGTAYEKYTLNVGRLHNGVLSFGTKRNFLESERYADQLVNTLDTADVDASFILGNYTRDDQTSTRGIIGIATDNNSGITELVFGTMAQSDTSNLHYGLDAKFGKTATLLQVGINKAPTHELDINGGLAISEGIYFTVPDTTTEDREDGYATKELIKIVRGGTEEDPTIDFYYNG